MDALLFKNDNEEILERNCLEYPIGGIIFRVDQLVDIGMYDKNLLMKKSYVKDLKKYSVERVPLPLYRYRQHLSNTQK